MMRNIWATTSAGLRSRRRPAPRDIPNLDRMVVTSHRPAVARHARGGLVLNAAFTGRRPVPIWAAGQRCTAGPTGQRRITDGRLAQLVEQLTLNQAGPGFESPIALQSFQ